MAEMGIAHKCVGHTHLRAAALRCNSNAPGAERAVNTTGKNGLSQGITNWIRRKVATSPAGM